jgi:hypothetical protein
MSNETIVAKLTSWAEQEARIFPDVSTCRFYSECNTNGILSGKHCMMSYLGREYLNGNDSFRLAIVGIDHAERESGSFEDRQRVIEYWYQSGRARFNQHYKGVAKTAAAVLGAEGAYCLRNCTHTCQKSHDPSAPCVLDRIVQPNMIKCVPDHALDRNSKATGTMWSNCANHLIAELRMLRPHLAVFHGAKARWFVLPAVRPESPNPVEDVSDRHGPVLYEWPSLRAPVSDRHGPVLYEWPSLRAHLLFLHHPARSQLDRQWDTVVAKAIAYLRAKGAIPA